MNQPAANGGIFVSGLVWGAVVLGAKKSILLVSRQSFAFSRASQYGECLLRPMDCHFQTPTVTAYADIANRFTSPNPLPYKPICESAFQFRSVHLMVL